jgi:hypothetical protein
LEVSVLAEVAEVDSDGVLSAASLSGAQEIKVSKVVAHKSAASIFLKFFIVGLS